MEHLKLILLIASFIIPLILGSLFITLSGKNIPKKIIGFSLINTFFVFAANYLYFQKLYTPYSYIHSLHIASVLWIFPSIFIYIQQISGISKGIRHDLRHLMPGLIFGLFSAMLFYGLLSQHERIHYLSTYRTGPEFAEIKFKIVALFRLLDVLFIVIQVVYYSIRFIKLTRTHNLAIEEEFSNTEIYSLQWLRSFTFSFVLVGLLSILFYTFNPFGEKNEMFLLFFLFNVSLFIWLMGIWAFRQENPEMEINLIPQIDRQVDEDQPQIHELARRLIALFEEQAPYLQPDINLSSLSRDLCTNRSYLSCAINSIFGMNFNSLIKIYRVWYIEEYIRQNPQTKTNDLVEIGGFGSLSSFRRAMKEKSKLIGKKKLLASAGIV